MGIKDYFKRSPIDVSEEYYPQIVKSALDVSGDVKPNFKGEVKKNEITFPAVLGEEHPFDFKITEGLYKKFGFATGVVDKYVDFIVGPGFWVSSEDERATKIIEDWMQDVNFDTILRGWVKEGLVKNGFLELGGKKNETVKGAKILDSKYMYVKRDKFGTIEKYNQYRGGFDKFAKEKVNPFDPHQIAHISFNKIGDMPYGMGIIYPAVNTIDNLLQNEKDLHMLMSRKANAPYHVKLGGVVGGKYFKPNPATVASFGKDLEWLNNKHEWVTDGLTEIKVIDFGNIGEKFNEVLKYDVDMLIYTFQVPAVLMGMANINEGIAKVQMDGFERRINSFQMEIEKVIEQKIFKRILNTQGLDVHVEFNWGRPSNTERYDRLMKITPIMTSMTTSQTLLRLLERETVKLLELDEEEFEEMAAEEDIEKEKQKEEEKKREAERPQAIVPGQNARPPQKVKQNYEILDESCHCAHCSDLKESGDKYNNVEEWLGFNYKEYVNEIEDFIRKDEFIQIAAATKLDVVAGMLTKKQVETFKGILENGFKKGDSILDMVNEVNKKLGLKDLLKMENGKIIKKDGKNVVLSHKENRATVIVRTEVTRTANEGAMNHFKEGGINKIRWVSSFGSRTCPTCEGLNGMVYEIGQHPGIPQHPMCRCTVVPVTGVA